MRRRITLLLPIALFAAALAPVGTRAASPGSGTLSFANPSLAWSNSLPMNGSAPAVTRATCQAPTTCDDYKLTVDRGSDAAAYLTLALTPTGPLANEEIIIYGPDCTDTSATAATACYSVLGTTVHLTGPPNGDYTIRVACTQCADAGYSMAATLAAQPPTPHIPGPFDTSFGWKVNLLPGTDAKGTGQRRDGRDRSSSSANGLDVDGRHPGGERPDPRVVAHGRRAR